LALILVIGLYIYVVCLLYARTNTLITLILRHNVHGINVLTVSVTTSEQYC